MPGHSLFDWANIWCKTMIFGGNKGALGCKYIENPTWSTFVKWAENYQYLKYEILKNKENRRLRSTHYDNVQKMFRLCEQTEVVEPTFHFKSNENDPITLNPPGPCLSGKRVKIKKGKNWNLISSMAKLCQIKSFKDYNFKVCPEGRDREWSH